MTIPPIAGPSTDKPKPEAKLELCNHLKLDFTRVAKSHGCIGHMWKIAAIVFAVAAAALLIGMIALQFGSAISLFEVAVIFGSFGGLTALVTHILWKAGTAAFTQQTFYLLVADRAEYLRANWDQADIETFFAEQEISLPSDPEILQLLSSLVPLPEVPTRALIPAIAHFQTLQEQMRELESGPEFKIKNAKRALDKMNAAVILQMLHKPAENISVKLDERQVSAIGNLGNFDLISIIAEKSTDAFIFNKQKNEKEAKTPIPIDRFQDLQPKDIRPLLFS